MVFPVVMCECGSWTIKKADCQRIDAFKLWCWGRLLSIPWTARRSNQSILKKINPEYSLKGLMLKLKLQCFGHLMWRTDSLEKTLMLGKTEDKRRRQRMRWLDSIIDSMDINLSKLQDKVKDRGDWCAAVHGNHGIRHNLPSEQQKNNNKYTHIQKERKRRQMERFLEKCLYVVMIYQRCGWRCDDHTM